MVPSGHAPERDVSQAGGGHQCPSVFGERQPHALAIQREFSHHLSRGCIPEPQRVLLFDRSRSADTGEGQQGFRRRKGGAHVTVPGCEMSQLLPGLQVIQEEPVPVHHADRQPVAIGRSGERFDFAFLAKREQCVAAGLLPEITPFPAAQILLARLGPLAVQQIQRAAEIVAGQCLCGDVHVRGVGALARGEFSGFGLFAQFCFFGLRRQRLLGVGLGLLALHGFAGLRRESFPLGDAWPARTARCWR